MDSVLVKKLYHVLILRVNICIYIYIAMYYSIAFAYNCDQTYTRCCTSFQHWIWYDVVMYSKYQQMHPRLTR